MSTQPLYIAAPATPGAKAADTSGTVTAAQAAALVALGVKVLVRTVPNSSAAVQNMTPQEMVWDTAAGLAIWLYQELRFSGWNAASGVADAQLAISNAKMLGYDPSIPIFTDLEYNSGFNASDLQAYIDNWIDTLHASGYTAGAYDSYSRQAYGLNVSKFDCLWQSAWKPTAPPPMPYMMFQAQPEFYAGGQAFDPDTVANDSTIMPNWCIANPNSNVVPINNGNFGDRVAAAAEAANVPCSQTMNKDAYIDCVIRPADRNTTTYYFNDRQLSTCGLFVERCLEKAGMQDRQVVGPYTYMDGGAIVQEQVVAAHHKILEYGTPAEIFKRGDCPIIDNGSGKKAHTWVICKDAIANKDGTWTLPLIVQGGLYESNGQVLDSIGGSSGVDRRENVLMTMKDGKLYLGKDDPGDRWVIATVRCSRASDIPDPNPKPTPPAPKPEPIPAPAPTPEPAPPPEPSTPTKSKAGPLAALGGGILVAAWAWIQHAVVDHPYVTATAIGATVLLVVLIVYLMIRKKA